MVCFGRFWVRGLPFPNATGSGKGVDQFVDVPLLAETPACENQGPFRIRARRVPNTQVSNLEQLLQAKFLTLCLGVQTCVGPSC